MLERMPTIVPGSRIPRKIMKALVISALFVTGCTRPNLEAVGGGGDLGSVDPPDLGVQPGGDDGGGMMGGKDGGGMPGGNDYAKDGPRSSTTFNLQVEKGFLDSFTITVHMPSGNGPFPLVVLSSGLLQPATAYAPYARRLASWGIITITRDDPGFGAQVGEIVEDLEFLVGEWLATQQQDTAGKLGGMMKLSRIGLAGHSRGGQASLLAAEGKLKGIAKAFFGLDPVDARPQSLPFPPPPPLARTALPSIGIPTVFLGETTNSTGGVAGMACAPAADNYQVLYAAAPHPSLEITAVGADHTDFEDAASCNQCNQCTPGTADGKLVLLFSVRYLTAFFARELLDDLNVGSTLTGAGITADIAANLVTLQSK
jgi:fermentation-respiration switch protein FrsA (DUF1100 family)